MCVGIPLRVTEVEPEAQRARCVDRHGEEHWIDLWLVGPQEPGTWLLSFLGAAREVIDAERAHEINLAIDALGALLAGESPDLDAAFADLVGREPQLPDFLRGNSA